MKILAISNLYPPHYVGGYELVCQSVMEHFAATGDEVTILTSRWREESDAPPVVRKLEFHQRLLGITTTLTEAERAKRDVAIFEETYARVQPDLLSIWNLDCLSKALLGAIEQKPVPRVFHIGDRYLCFTQGRWFSEHGRNGYRWASDLDPTTLYAPDFEGNVVPCSIPHALFPSYFLERWHQERGIHPEHTRVIRNPLPGSFFEPLVDRSTARDFLHAILPGRIAEYKGVHTALEGFRLFAERVYRSFRRDVHVLKVEDEAYMASLEARVRDGNMEEQIRFVPGTPRDEMTRLYDTADLLIFASECEEALGLVLPEGLARGIFVISTDAGGAREVIRHEETGLVFPQGDAVALADNLERWLDEPDLREQFRKAGRDLVQREYHPDKCLGEYTAYYQDVLAAHNA